MKNQRTSSMLHINRSTGIPGEMNPLKRQNRKTNPFF